MDPQVAYLESVATSPTNLEQGVPPMAYDDPGKSALSQSEIKRRLHSVSGSYAQQAHTVFRAIPDIEGTSTEELRAIAVAGTILQPAADGLQNAGIPTNGSVGDLMDKLGLNHDEMHSIACACHGDRIPGSYMAHTFYGLAEAL